MTTEGKPGNSVLSFEAGGQSRDETVIGLPVEWDQQTVGGNWLRQRETWMRTGRFTAASHSPFRELHEKFPYKLHMPLWQLEQYNEELRMCYRHSIRRQRWPDHTRVQSRQGGECQLHSLPSHPRLLLPGATKSLSLTQRGDIDQTSHSISDDMPVTAFMRSRRLVEFAQREKRESQSTVDTVTQDGVRNIKSLMRDAGIDTQQHEVRLRQETSIPLHDITNGYGTYEGPTSPDRPAVSPKQISVSSSFESHSSAMAQSTSPTEETDGEQRRKQPQVPLTLFPDLSSDERPRDEDPQIMPLPRELGFSFDARQLRDLAVIKEGGNGCAIEGYEFELQEEDNDEWIGSAVVDLTERHSNKEGTTKNENDQERYEFGQGDQDGLLAELPGL